MEARRAIGHPVIDGRRPGAGPLPALLTGRAAEARRVPGERDEVTDARSVDTGTRRVDDSCALVTEDDRAGALPVAVADMEIRMADARGKHPDAHLAATWLVENKVLDRDRRSRSLHDGGARSPSCRDSLPEPLVARGEPEPYAPPMSVPLPPGFRWPDGIRAAACFTFDVDAESAILAEHAEAAGWLDVISHQAYGPRTGVPRLLRLLDRLAVRATFFVPGYSAERWPAVVRSIRDAGHEIGHHGFMHEGARSAPDEATEERRIVRGLEALDAVAGIRPVGYRAPSWEASYRLPGLLARHGFLYDSGLMDADHPYRLASSSAPGAASIIELPVHWSLDDWEPYNYLPAITGSGVIASPRDVVDRWLLELAALVDEGALFMLTNHPFVSGRASRASELGRLIETAKATDGLWIATAGEIAEWTATLPLEPVVHDPPAMPPPP
jgi:peptidoglycan/xylan/chitin deacetylase (PgdA/CDA1 family)